MHFSHQANPLTTHDFIQSAQERFMPFQVLDSIFSSSDIDSRRFKVTLLHNTDTDTPTEVVLMDNCVQKDLKLIPPSIQCDDALFSHELSPSEFLNEINQMQPNQQKDFDVSLPSHAMILRVKCWE